MQTLVGLLLLEAVASVGAQMPALYQPGSVGYHLTVYGCGSPPPSVTPLVWSDYCRSLFTLDSFNRAASDPYKRIPTAYVPAYYRSLVDRVQVERGFISSQMAQQSQINYLQQALRR